MKKIIAFVRTSTLKQGVSIKNQIQQIKDYAKKENLTISEIINEEGVSGDSLKRVGFDRMMDLVENKEIDGVLCYWISRAGRRLVETLELINSCLENKVALISVKEGIDTRNAGGRIQAKMMALWAEEELIGIRERIKEVISYKKKNGLKYNGTPAYGTYVKNGLLYEDELEMKIVRNMKNQRSRGWSWYKIMKRLNEMDIPTKMKSSKGWTINQIKSAYNYHYGDNEVALIR